ncbi:hypothetical protein IQ254_30355 [Nodosilinea sp. LEGE 07088]|nr:hypothetical protein [Nodosilinea sp. LEGE 07088]
MSPTISIHNLSNFSGISTLKNVFQSLAMLDAVLSPEWEYRYYSFDSKWSSSEMLGSMRNGSGDHLFALFNSFGCIVKGFNHEAPLHSLYLDPCDVSKEVLQSLPDRINGYLQEPALVSEEITFCLWRSYTDANWKATKVDCLNDSDDPDGSGELLMALKRTPQEHKLWVDEYYEVDVPIELVNYVYEHRPFTQATIEKYCLDNFSLSDLLKLDSGKFSVQ